MILFYIQNLRMDQMVCIAHFVNCQPINDFNQDISSGDIHKHFQRQSSWSLLRVLTAWFLEPVLCTELWPWNEAPILKKLCRIQNWHSIFTLLLLQPTRLSDRSACTSRSTSGLVEAPGSGSWPRQMECWTWKQMFRPENQSPAVSARQASDPKQTTTEKNIRKVS